VAESVFAPNKFGAAPLRNVAPLDGCRSPELLGPPPLLSALPQNEAVVAAAAGAAVGALDWLTTCAALPANPHPELLSFCSAPKIELPDEAAAAVVAGWLLDIGGKDGCGAAVVSAEATGGALAAIAGADGTLQVSILAILCEPDAPNKEGPPNVIGTFSETAACTEGVGACTPKTIGARSESALAVDGSGAPSVEAFGVGSGAVGRCAADGAEAPPNLIGSLSGAMDAVAAAPAAANELLEGPAAAVAPPTLS
jgi:hypothetical protein